MGSKAGGELDAYAACLDWNRRAPAAEQQRARRSEPDASARSSARSNNLSMCRKQQEAFDKACPL